MPVLVFRVATWSRPLVWVGRHHSKYFSCKPQPLQSQCFERATWTEWLHSNIPSSTYQRWQPIRLIFDSSLLRSAKVGTLKVGNRSFFQYLSLDSIRLVNLNRYKQPGSHWWFWQDCKNSKCFLCRSWRWSRYRNSSTTPDSLKTWRNEQKIFSTDAEEAVLVSVWFRVESGWVS